MASIEGKIVSIAEFHPIAVHFPIAYFLSLAGFDVLMLALGHPISGRTCIANISAALAALAGAAAIAAYIFGDIAYDTAVAGGVAAAKLETHQTLGTITAVSLALWGLCRAYFWWRRVPLDGGRKAAVAGIEIAGAALIVTTAFFGGQLVYELGVNVARAAGG
jgi:uncharacterized membrane protein